MWVLDFCIVAVSHMLEEKSFTVCDDVPGS